MPTIAMFYGIIIRMYAAPKEHNPPHIHVFFGEYAAIVSIETGEILEGDFPPRKMKMVQVWIDIHLEDLRADWNLAMNSETPLPIDPLR